MIDEDAFARDRFQRLFCRAAAGFRQCTGIAVFLTRYPSSPSWKIPSRLQPG